jgi:hypothetical protein
MCIQIALHDALQLLYYQNVIEGETDFRKAKR